jgi:hypothetical protein
MSIFQYGKYMFSKFMFYCLMGLVSEFCILQYNYVINRWKKLLRRKEITL